MFGQAEKEKEKKSTAKAAQDAGQTGKGAQGAAKNTSVATTPAKSAAETAKSALTNFFARSSIITLIHSLQQTWQKVKTDPTPMGLVAAETNRGMLEDGVVSVPFCGVLDVCSPRAMAMPLNNLLVQHTHAWGNRITHVVFDRILAEFWHLLTRCRPCSSSSRRRRS